MPTVLWFENEGELRDLVAAGEVSMCFNLVRHLESEGGELYRRASGLWYELTR